MEKQEKMSRHPKSEVSYRFSQINRVIEMKECNTTEGIVNKDYKFSYFKEKILVGMRKKHKIEKILLTSTTQRHFERFFDASSIDLKPHCYVYEK